MLEIWMYTWQQTAVLLTVALASVAYALLLVYRRANAFKTGPDTARGHASTVPSNNSGPTNRNAAQLFRGDSAEDSALHGSAQPKACCTKTREVEDASRGSFPVQPEEPACIPVQVNRCPFGHGSVGTGPYPGYVHGRHPAICKNGCKPDPQLGKYGHSIETPHQTLVREALEYQEIYHRDKGSAPGAKEARVQQILAEIAATGSYTHTADELEHGARVAWRNAPKCSNRKFWSELKLIDSRTASTPSEMLAACPRLLEDAGMSCATTANIVVFRGQTPGREDGPRVWNNQLIRFGGYREAGSGKVLGDPAEADFTQMLIDEYGWQPPSPRGMFDVLPLLLQAHPDRPPQLFEIPSQYVVRVPITHPTCKTTSALGLQWYSVSAVSNMELSVGGITYTAAPFNGWYSVTEIVRNLADAMRYDMLPRLASCLGLDTRQDSSLWRDRAIVELGVAVLHSFKEAGMGIIDHHTLMRNFFSWWSSELKVRGYSPGNWKWIIPPMSPSTSRCYLELNKMTDYTLKPGYWIGPGWQKYRASLTAKSEALLVPSSVPEADAAAVVVPAVLDTAIKEAAATATPDSVTDSCCTDAVSNGSDTISGSGGSCAVSTASRKAVSVVLAYANVSHNTERYAEAITSVLEGSGRIKVLLLNMEDFESHSWSKAMSGAQLVLLLISTYGPGACPASASKFIAWLKKGGCNDLAGKPFCVLGFGSSSDPRFCAAADTLHTAMLAATTTTNTTTTTTSNRSSSRNGSDGSCSSSGSGGSGNGSGGSCISSALLPPAKADAVAGEEGVVWPWVKQVASVMCSKGWLDQCGLEAVLDLVPAATCAADPSNWQPGYRIVCLDPASTAGKGDPRGPLAIAAAAAQDSGAHVVSVKRVVELLGPRAEPGASTKLIVLDVAGTPCGRYLPGDEVAVWAQNDPELVVDFAANLGISGTQLDTRFLLEPTQGGSEPAPKVYAASSQRFTQPTPFRDVLTMHIGLSERLKHHDIAVLSRYAPDDTTLQQLAMSPDSFAAWAAQKQPRWRDLFDLFPSLVRAIPLSAFFSLAPLMPPRYYSVASASAAVPEELALCVGLFNRQLPSGGTCSVRQGFCSSFLCGLTPGSCLRIKLVSQPSFRLPFDAAAPVVMIAAGTGVAPFRGFWQERASRLQQGQLLGSAVLLYGCRSADRDLLFHEEVQEMLGLGVMSQVLVAFSREEAQPKTYVQDLIARHTPDLTPLLSHPKCHVYICGGNHMAQAAAKALETSMGADKYAGMLEQARVHEEVFNVESTSHVVEAATAVTAAETTLQAPVVTMAAAGDAGGMVVKLQPVTAAPQCHGVTNPEKMPGDSFAGPKKPSELGRFKLQLGKLLCFQ